MRNLTENDILQSSGDFKVKGKDGKTYAFDITAMFYDDTNTFKWCIATPKTKNKKLANSTDSVLFKMRKNGNNDIAELVPDIATMKKVFDAYNKFVDEING